MLITFRHKSGLSLIIFNFSLSHLLLDGEMCVSSMRCYGYMGISHWFMNEYSDVLIMTNFQKIRNEVVMDAW